MKSGRKYLSDMKSNIFPEEFTFVLWGLHLIIYSIPSFVSSQDAQEELRIKN